MRKILLFSFNRSEFGFLKPLLYQLEKNKKKINYKFFVTGTHFDKEFGESIKEIITTKFLKYKTIKTLNTSTKKYEILRVTKKFNKIIKSFKPDFIFLPGDRHELIPVAYVALTNNIPIVHYGGGQITEGSWDNQVRNSISKLSHIHFVSTKFCKKRLIRMGENKKKIFVSGSLGIANIKQKKLKHKNELNKIYNFDFNKKYFLVTLHPNTFEIKKTRIESLILFNTLKKIKDYTFIITAPNNDPGYHFLIKIIKKYEKIFPNKFKFIPSFGNENYISALKWSNGLIGNSSSGIIEAPSLGVPVINIGDRQKNRYKNLNVIDIDFSERQIKKAIIHTKKKSFIKKINKKKNIYSNGNAAKKIVNELKKISLNNILQKQS